MPDLIESTKTMSFTFDKGKLIALLLGGLGITYVGSRVVGTPTVAALGPPGGLAVHVSGIVKNPGLYRLSPGARVDDAIKAAGGPGNGADVEKLNLAALVKDGEKVTVPGAEAAKLSDSVPVDAPGDSAEPAVGKLSLSKASAEELRQLPGVGPATVQKIVDYRILHGGFTSVEELRSVGGIGLKKFEKRSFKMSFLI